MATFQCLKALLWPKSSDFSVVQQGYRRFPRLPGGAVITDVFIQPSAAHMTRSSGLNLSNNVTLNASLHQRTEEVMFFFLLWSNEIFKYTQAIMCHDEQAKLTLHYLNVCCQICRYNFCVHLHLLRRWGCAEAPLRRSCLFVFPWKCDSCKATPAKSRNKNIHSFIQFLPLHQSSSELKVTTTL